MDPHARLASRIAASLALVGVVTTMYFVFVPVNPTTVALTYVVVVLLIALRWGIWEATTASIAAVACFNFFFLSDRTVFATKRVRAAGSRCSWATPLASARRTRC